MKFKIKRNLGQSKFLVRTRESLRKPIYRSGKINQKSLEGKPRVTKRQMLVFFSALMTLGLVVSLVSTGRSLFVVAALLAVMSSLLTIWVLKEDLAGIKYIVLPILPAFFTFGMALFFQLLPVRWLTRVPFTAIYAVSIYLIFLNQNVYNIAAIRTIALLRAAHSVGLLFTLISAFLVLNVVFSLKLNFVVLAIAVTFVAGLLLFQALWSFELEDVLTKRLLTFTLVFSLMVLQVVIGLSFWPALPSVLAGVVTTQIYVLLGLTQGYYAGRLVRRMAVEYIILGVTVFLLLLFTTSWA